MILISYLAMTQFNSMENWSRWFSIQFWIISLKVETCIFLPGTGNSIHLLLWSDESDVIDFTEEEKKGGGI